MFLWTQMSKSSFKIGSTEWQKLKDKNKKKDREKDENTEMQTMNGSIYFPRWLRQGITVKFP